MQRVFYERRQELIPIPLPDRRQEERRKIYQAVPIEQRQILTYTPSKVPAELIVSLKKSAGSRDTRVASRVAVDLPIVIDFRGNLSRGVTADMSLDSLSIITDISIVKGSSVSIQFCFGQDFAYMNLAGYVASVKQEDGNPGKRFRSVIRLFPMADAERAILGSCLHELGLACVRDLSVTNNAGSKSESNPRSILSLFITDNSYLLHYHKSQSQGRKSDHLDPSSKVEFGMEPRTNGSRKVFSPRFSWLLVPQAFRIILDAVRDLLVRLLPFPVSRLLVQNIAFAFIVHPRDLSDVSRKAPFAQFLPSRLVDLWLRYQWPVIGSYITGLKTRDGKEVTGAMLISPLTTKQMIQDHRLARKRVYQTVRLAEKLGARIAGLGAFTSIVTKDGQDLKGKVSSIGITTGNSYSAAVAVQNVVMAAILTNLSLPHSTAAIVGGAGSVGSVCAKLLSRIVDKLILVDIRTEELHKIMQQLQGQSFQLEATDEIDKVKQADIVIAATNSPYTVISTEHLKPGAIVIDAAQPKNVSEQIPLQRRDVLVIESAIVSTPGVDCNFDLGLGSGEALGCLSETMILTAISWQGHYALGKADPKQAAEMLAAGRELGFRLAYFRNSQGYITEEDLVRVMRARMGTS